MKTEELTHTLTKVRDEAHALSKEKLAANEPKPARLKRAQELDAELFALQRDIDRDQRFAVNQYSRSP